jgi:FMN-dependent oxidoreductase (nitrilotriacetate monooxygenase family)
MHVGVFANIAGNHVAGWRIPGAFTSAEEFSAILSVVRDAERHKLDFVFFADGPVSALDGHPGFMLNLEPTVLLGALAGTTSRIGLVATVSSTFTEPYNLARTIASVDQISGGRVAWNLVTTSDPAVALNFGRDLPPHDLRYEIATEYIQVVKSLWDSWEAGARIADKASGTYYDTEKVHVLGHEGEYYKVRGPIGVSRSPQGQPVVVQAGSSPAGREFAARFAEVVFTIQQDLDDARTFYAGLKSMMQQNGRPSEQCCILPGLFPVVGATLEQARAKLAQLAAFVEPGSALGVMSQRFGEDMSKYPMDGPMPDLSHTDGTRGYTSVLYKKAQREGLTLREVHNIMALSRGYLLVVGTPDTVVDTMEEWYQTEACDGFVILPAHFPEAFNDFTELAVPELRRRGLFREDYAGTTLRSHLGLAEPVNQYVMQRENQRSQPVESTSL